ncbi:MAG: hypothetical protein CL677_05185 [Bdellovibrionaceae bacterium]|nr:hypothetical protein [Pseudobdellovibrionaceae bacterium]|tara:strand:- start:77670 stop:79529 length:1860 start_codon:yes stop_codon:yes gene_type:complete
MQIKKEKFQDHLINRIQLILFLVLFCTALVNLFTTYYALLNLGKFWLDPIYRDSLFAKSLLVFILFTSTLLIRRRIKSLSPLDRSFLTSREFYFSFSIFFISLGAACIASSFVSLWSDEFAQMHDAIIDPIVGATRHHQVPLGFYFSYLTNLLFGEHPISIRFPNYLCFGLMNVVLYNTMRRLNVPHVLSVFGLIFLFGNFLIYKYSFEARPQAIAFLFLAFLVYEIIVFLSQRETSQFHQALYLTSSLTLFLLSLGFQPPFLVLSLTLSVALFFGIHIGLWKLGIIFLSSIASLILFLPFVIGSIGGGAPRLIHMSLSDFLERDILNFQLINFMHLGLFNFDQPWIATPVFAAIGLGSIAIFNKVKTGKCRQIELLGPTLILASVISVLLSYNFMFHHIKYPPYPKYFCVPLITFFTGITLSLSSLFRPLSLCRKPLKWGIYITTFISFLLVFNIYWASSLNISRDFRRFDSLSSIKSINNFISPGEPVICIYPGAQDITCIYIIEALEYLHWKSPNASPLNLHDLTVGHYKKPAHFQYNRAVILQYGSNPLSKESSLTANDLKTESFGQGFAIYLENKDGVKDDVIQILKKLISQHDPMRDRNIEYLNSYVKHLESL